MAKGFDVLHVKSAVKTHNDFDLSRTHLTTMNFGEIVPLMVEETVPGDKFNVGATYFSRMAPLVKPTYGKFSFKTVTAFVPYHQIADDADPWLAGQTTWEGSTTRGRFIKVSDLSHFVTDYCASASVVYNGSAVTATSANCDVTFVNSAGTRVYQLFTPSGRYWVKVLNALGYAVPQNINYQAGAGWTFGSEELSAYPLLAYFKAYNDYMSQSQRFNSSDLTAILKAVKHNTTFAGYSTSSGEISAVGLGYLFRNLKLNYETDYFTSAWQSPNNPINSVESVTNFRVNYDASGGYVGLNNNANNVEISSPDSTAGYSTKLPQRALDFLKAFDDWVRRNNYSGSRAVQQVYSRFGIKPDDYRSNYAHVIKTDSQPVQVGDVTATAQGAQVALGDYAGKGIVSGNDGFEYKADDYGLLMVLGYYTVVPMNSYGFDRRVLRSTPLEFFNPEFDGLGAEAISYGELFTNPTVTGDTSSDLGLFGFTERYNSYKYGRDVITGEFRNYHANGDMNTWHTGRLLTDLRKAGTMVAQSSAMNTLENAQSQYNRIFSITDDAEDKFYLTAQFNVKAIRPMLSLNQSVRLGEGDTVVPRNGNVIS